MRDSRQSPAAWISLEPIVGCEQISQVGEFWQIVRKLWKIHPQDTKMNMNEPSVSN